jgi:hypothetical protein
MAQGADILPGRFANIQSLIFFLFSDNSPTIMGDLLTFT